MPQWKQNKPFIVADIGGTNARFATMKSVDTKAKKFVIEDQQTYPSASFDGIEQAVSSYLETTQQKIKVDIPYS